MHANENSLMEDEVVPDGVEHSAPQNSHRRRGSAVWILLGLAGIAAFVGCARKFGVGRDRADFESRIPDRPLTSEEEDEGGAEVQPSSPAAYELPPMACDDERDLLPLEIEVSAETESADHDAAVGTVEEISSADAAPHVEDSHDDASPGLFVDPLAMRDRRGSFRR